MTEETGLLAAFVLDGKGGGEALDWEGIDRWSAEDGVLWVHLDRTVERAQSWVQSLPAVPPAVCETLLNAQGNRPRVSRVGEALVVMLRGLNRDVGAESEDMPTMHMWVSPKIVISLRRRRLLAGNQIRALIDAGEGPTNASQFLVLMCERLLEPMAEVFADLEDEIESIHDRVATEESGELRVALRELRHSATLLRRHLAPQREALTRLATEVVSWVSDSDRGYLRETADRVTRYVEDIDSARERAAISQEELTARIADQMNRTMYLLTIVSALLLPPSLLTGLFGINVGGMPGVESQTAFAIVAITIPVLAVIEIVVLRRMRWI